ncbi:hypothetical protein TNCV_648571 [Trichonephila clavipes]|uniref:Uncharacterized protein n=1 Tax=Trichonephila clavipes TaxID=2585209 RepID=A0A8X6VNU0_TRICX|nr:hypothetical protein TNCV_648571 [Trichonephila clavipes]
MFAGAYKTYQQKSASETFDLIRYERKTGTRKRQYLHHSRRSLVVHHYDSTIKQQNSEWKHLSSPTSEKAKTVSSAGKVKTIIFFDYEGIMYQHAVEPSTTVNGSCYANALRTMIQHKRKRPLLRNGFLLHHDNA